MIGLGPRVQDFEEPWSATGLHEYYKVISLYPHRELRQLP